MAEYIERKALIKERHACDRDCATCDFARDGDSWCEGELFVVDVLRIPTADVRPVVRGEWIWDDNGMDWGIGAWLCSECKVRPETWWATLSDCKPLRCSGSKYCGNCGADMRGATDGVEL